MISDQSRAEALDLRCAELERALAEANVCERENFRRAEHNLARAELAEKELRAMREMYAKESEALKSGSGKPLAWFTATRGLITCGDHEREAWAQDGDVMIPLYPHDRCAPLDSGASQAQPGIDSVRVYVATDADGRVLSDGMSQIHGGNALAIYAEPREGGCDRVVPATLLFPKASVPHVHSFERKLRGDRLVCRCGAMPAEAHERRS